MEVVKKNTPEARLDKAGAEFKRLEAKIEKMEVKITLLESKYENLKGNLTKEYNMIAEVSKVLLNIVNTKLNELANKKA